MPLTPEEIFEHIEKLKNELNQLNEQYDKSLKALGITEEELKAMDRENESPEVKKLLAEAEKAAKLAGEQRAQEAKRQGQPKSSSKATPSRRSGAIPA
jgi:regulator of replication initiation timing